MENQIVPQPAVDAGTLRLGAVLGQIFAMGTVAGGCSAVRARLLKDLRDSKEYKVCCSEWKQFCPEFLKMSRTQVDRIISLYEQYGDQYFELSQLTPISPETYQIVEPIINDGAIHFEGEVIAINPENARKVASVVAELRRQAGGKSPAAPTGIEDRIADIDKRFAVLIADIETAFRKGGDGASGLIDALDRMSANLTRVRTENCT
ncbi:conserved hypothetical protein [Candidatus Sulfopaludibacter sp. SbA4]|nr:conserved hypothetical protein [Candidatus Sulfopaludibacter sp. SbA4]